MTQINGVNGIYDNIIKNPYVRYGRNANNNYYAYMQEKYPEDEEYFEYRYSPSTQGNKIHPMALLGASFEELEATKVPLEEFAQDDSTCEEEIIPYETAKILDLNHDGYVDVSEYATLLLFEDTKSSYNYKPNGVISVYGQADVLETLDTVNKALILTKLKGFYKEFHLKDAQEEFLSDENNTLTLNV